MPKSLEELRWEAQQRANERANATGTVAKEYRGEFQSSENPNTYTYSNDTSRTAIQHGPYDSSPNGDPSRTLRRNGPTDWGTQPPGASEAFDELDADAILGDVGFGNPQRSEPGYVDPDAAVTGINGMRGTGLADLDNGFYAGARPQPSVPGASEAFAQLDQAQPSNPTQFDAASVAGLEPAQQQMVRENFDANLEAATRAVEEYAQGDDAFSRQAQRLLERAERARERQTERAMEQPRPDWSRFQKIAEPDYSQMAQPERSRAIRENARTGGQKFIPLTTPEDYQASSLADLEMKNGRDPFEI